MRPFDGIEVLDLTQSIAGPVATQYLAGLGANVIKVEPPEGDAFRDILEGAMFASVNMGGKQSISVDLKTPEGREVVHDLARRADVVVESFRPGVLARFDLDYESVRAENEDVVYCSVTGFGQDGPRAQWPAYDPVIQAMSGLMSTIGYPDRPPVRIGASVIDCTTGTTAALAISAALFERAHTGAGEYIDVNLFEVAVSWMAYWIANYDRTGQNPERSGQGFAGLAPNEVFHAADGDPIYIACVNDRLYGRLCGAIDRPDLREDDRFTSNENRWENREALRAELNGIFAEYDRDDLSDRLAEAGVPAGPLQTVEEVTNDPQVVARRVLTDSYNVKHDAPVQTVTFPFSTSEGRPDDTGQPPRTGEHTRRVLEALGYGPAQIDDLLEAGAVYETA